MYWVGRAGNLCDPSDMGPCLGQYAHMGGARSSQMKHRLFPLSSTHSLWIWNPHAPIDIDGCMDVDGYGLGLDF